MIPRADVPVGVLRLVLEAVDGLLKAQPGAQARWIEAREMAHGFLDRDGPGEAHKYDLAKVHGWDRKRGRPWGAGLPGHW